MTAIRGLYTHTRSSKIKAGRKEELHTSRSDCATVVKSVGRPPRAARASSLAFPAVPPAMERSLKVVEENTAAEAIVARREKMMVDFILIVKG